MIRSSLSIYLFIYLSIKSFLGPRVNDLSFQRCMLDASFSGPALGPQFGTPTWSQNSFFQDAWHGWNLANNISEPQFRRFCGDLGFRLLSEAFYHPLWHPVGTRSGHCRRQTARRGSRIDAGTSFVERTAFRAMEMDGNQWNPGAPQVTSKVKVYLTDKTYD